MRVATSGPAESGWCVCPCACTFMLLPVGRITVEPPFPVATAVGKIRMVRTQIKIHLKGPALVRLCFWTLCFDIAGSKMQSLGVL